MVMPAGEVVGSGVNVVEEVLYEWGGDGVYGGVGGFGFLYIVLWLNMLDCCVVWRCKREGTYSAVEAEHALEVTALCGEEGAVREEF